VLLVDDEPDILLAFTFNDGDDFEVLTAGSGAQGLSLLETHEPAVIVADQRMPAMSGTEFLERSMALRPDAVRIILTGYTDIDAIIQAINKSRIYRYVTKPWESEELRLTLRRAVEVFHLARENVRLVEELRRANERLAVENAYLREVERPQKLVGASEAMRNVLELIARVAGSHATVLLEGETGTGKELVARAIHAAGPRRDHLFVAINCAALSEGLLESELFGHRRGAFTGAPEDRKGLFPIRLPPLRDRREDIPALTRHLLGRLARQVKKPVPEPSEETLALLARYPFPGNVRELANELERAVLLAAPGAPITDDLLSERLQEAAGDGGASGLLQHRTDSFEREEIEAAIARAGGVKTRAAEELGITYRGLLKKMKRLGM